MLQTIKLVKSYEGGLGVRDTNAAKGQAVTTSSTVVAEHELQGVDIRGSFLSMSLILAEPQPSFDRMFQDYSWLACLTAQLESTKPTSCEKCDQIPLDLSSIGFDRGLSEDLEGKDCCVVNMGV